MKNNASAWLTILITCVVGILLIVWHNRLDVLQWIIIAMGLALAIPSAYNCFALFSSRNRGTSGNVRVSGVIASVAGVALGLWMIIQPTFFVGLLAYLFAGLMIAYGIFQIISLGWLTPFRMPGAFYVVPVILIVAGVLILCTTVRTMNSVVVLITGIMLVVSAVNWALQYTVTHPVETRRDNA